MDPQIQACDCGNAVSSLRYAATASHRRTCCANKRRGPAYVTKHPRTISSQSIGAAKKEKRTLLGRRRLNRRECSPPRHHRNNAPGTLTRLPGGNNTRGPSKPSLRKKGLCSAGGAPRRLVFSYVVGGEYTRGTGTLTQGTVPEKATYS